MLNHIENIRHWAYQRNLIEGSDPKSQFLKTVSEVGELADAINKGTRKEQMDGVGDIFVTLVIISTQLGFDIQEAVAAAWEEIKDRKGQMVNGVFVKEETK